MSKKRTVQLIFASLAAPLLLAGCVTIKEKVAETPPPPMPEQRLVVHDLTTDTGKKKLVAAQVDFTNKTGRSLEYVMFKTTAYDQQGQVVPSFKSGRPNAWLRIAGPIEHDSRTGAQRWEKVWASSAINCFRIEGAEVIYEDSSVEFYQLDQIELDLAMLPPALCQEVDKSLALTE